MKRLLISFTIVISMSIILTSCGDRLEMDRQAHVVVIGFDLPEDEKAQQNERLEITYQIANPQVGTSERGQAQHEPSSDIVTILAADVVNGRKLLKSTVSRDLNFGHLQAVIISEKLARSSHLHHVIAGTFNDVEIRREVDFYVTKEKASEFINKNKPKLETRPHKYYELMRENWKGAAFVPNANFNRYFQHLQGELFLAIYATTTREEIMNTNSKVIDFFTAGEMPQRQGDPVQILGSALIKNGKMIDSISGVETRLVLLLRPNEKLEAMLGTVRDPLDERYAISLQFLKEDRTSIEIDKKKNPVEVKVTVPLKVQLITVPSLIDYVYNMDNQRRLQEFLSENLEKAMYKLVERMQKEYKSEAFQWHLVARKKFWTLKQYDEFDWFNQFANAKVSINVDIEIVSFGKQYRMPKIKKTLGD